MQDYIQEFVFKVSDINLLFKLKNLLRLQIRSISEDSTNGIYKTVMTNQTLSDSIKKTFGSVDGLFTHFKVDAKQTECKFIRTQKDAQLFFKDDQNVNYEISFLLQIEGQKEPQLKEKNKLEKLLERQSELKENVARLQEEEKKVNQRLSQKTRQPQPSSLTEQIAKAELSLKAILLEEARMKQVKIDIQKHPQYGDYIDQYQEDTIRLNMVKQNVTDQIVQEIAHYDLSRIQQLILFDNKITDNGFDLLFQYRKWPVLQQIYLANNNIQKIHSLHKIPSLELLDIYQNGLSEASCIYLCEHQWPKLTVLGISFKVGLNDKCWEKLLTVMKEKFPKLNQIVYYLKRDVSLENQEKIATYCKNNSIKLFSY